MKYLVDEIDVMKFQRFSQVYLSRGKKKRYVLRNSIYGYCICHNRTTVQYFVSLKKTTVYTIHFPHLPLTIYGIQLYFDTSIVFAK